MSIKRWMNIAALRLANNGLGVSSTTHSLLPVFGGRTTTPKATHSTKVRQENEHHAQEAPLLIKKAAPLPHIYHLGSAAQDKKAQLISACPKKNDATHSLYDKRVYRQHVMNDAVFTKGSNLHDLDVLCHQIGQAIDNTPSLADVIVQPELAGVDHLVLSQALSLLFAGQKSSAASAARGLACLRNLNLLEQIRHPTDFQAAIKSNYPSSMQCDGPPRLEDVWKMPESMDGWADEVNSAVEACFNQLQSSGVGNDANVDSDSDSDTASIATAHYDARLSIDTCSGESDITIVAGPQSDADDCKGGTLIPCPAVGDPMFHGVYTDEDYANAWRIAQQLELTPTGFNILKRITVRPATTADLNGSIVRHDDAALHIFLKGSREKMKEVQAQKWNMRIKPDPRSIYQYVNSVRLKEQTLLDKGLLAIQDHLCQSAIAAKDPLLRKNTFALKKNADAWAAYAIRNEIYTDQVIDLAGKPSQFARLEGRTKKLSTWLQRAMKPSSIKKYLKKIFAAQQDKSVFHAFDRLGPSKWEWFRRIDKNGVGFKNSMGGGIGDGRTIKEEMMEPVALALKGMIVNNGASVDKLVRLAILEQQKDPSENIVLPRFRDLPMLTPHGVNRAKKRLGGWLEGGLPKNAEAIALIDHYFKKHNHPMTPQRLVAWAGDLGFRENPYSDIQFNMMSPMLHNHEQNVLSLQDKVFTDWAAAAAKVMQGQNDEKKSRCIDKKNTGHHADYWAGFRQAMVRVMDKQRNKDIDDDGNESTEKAKIVPLEAEWDDDGNFRGIPKIRDLSVKEAAEMFEEAVSRQELGSSFELSSGGLVGFKTGGITETLSAIASGSFLRAKLDVRGERHRCAFINVGTLTNGNEIIMGSVTTKKARGGIGGGFGPGKVSKKLGGGTTIGLATAAEGHYGYDVQQKRAIVFRFPRLETLVGGDKPNNIKLGKLLNKMMQNDPTDPLGSPLKRALHDYGEELSVSWLHSEEFTHRVVGSMVAGAGLSMGGNVGLANGVGVGAEYKEATEDWQEKGGSVRVYKDIRSKTFTANVSGILASIVAAFPEFTAESIKGVLSNGLGEGAVKGILNVANEVFGTGSVQFYRWGKSTRDTWVERDGELRNPAIFRTVTYPNAASFVAAVAEKLDVMAIDKTKKFVASQYHADLNHKMAATPEQQSAQEAERAAAIKREYSELRKHLAEALQNQTMTHAFQEYYEPKKEVVKAMNDYLSLAQQAEKMGDKNAAKAYRDMVDKMKIDDNSWEWSFVTSIDKESDIRLRGLDFIGKYQQIDSINTSTMLDFN